MGRRRIHVDDAARQAAYRERRAEAAARGDMALAVLDMPSPLLIERLARRAAARAADGKGPLDPAALAEAFAQALLRGLEAGAGRNCADAARNAWRYRDD